MDSLVLYLYLIEKLDCVKAILQGAAFTLFVYLMICTICSFFEKDFHDFEESVFEIMKTHMNVKKTFMWIFVFMFVDFILPSYKTNLMLVTNHYIKKSDVPQKVMQVINNELDKYIEKQKGDSV